MITDEMVDKALSAYYSPRDKWPDDWPEKDWSYNRDRMRKALSAVAPMIRAPAFEEAALTGARQVVTDAMVNKFIAEEYCSGREGRGYVESVRKGLEAAAPMIGDAEKLRACQAGEIFTLAQVANFVEAARNKALEEGAKILDAKAIELKKAMASPLARNILVECYEDASAAIRAMKEQDK